jgi:V-type H+-transporting ATPase S1 subunit
LLFASFRPTHFPALGGLSSEEFSTLVRSQTDKDTLTIVFVENSLSSEDLSECRLKTETCFENLRKIQKKTYLTAVEDPIKALKSTFGKAAQKSISLSNDGDLSEQVDTNARVVFVNLEDVEGNEDFAKHGELNFNPIHIASRDR